MLGIDGVHAAVVVLYTGLTGIAIGFAVAVIAREWTGETRWPVVALAAAFVGLALVDLIEEVVSDRGPWVVWSSAVALALTIVGVVALVMESKQEEGTKR